MGGMKSDKELDSWQLAMTLVETTYRVTELLPDGERYGLVSQMRRCAVSLPSNIAEGQARGTARFGLYFVRIAIGSSAELTTQLELARRLKFLTAETTRGIDDQLDRVRQMLYGMQREHLRRIGASGGIVISLFFLLRASGFLA